MRRTLLAVLLALMFTHARAQPRALAVDIAFEQCENQPYGQAFYRIAKATFPDGDPYHHTTIGSMSDLDAATLDDVKNWFDGRVLR